MKGPPDHNDPPGYQSRQALRVKQQRPTGQFGGVTNRMTYEQQQEINIVIVGSPETVTRKLTETITKLNPGYLHIYGNEGAMPHKDVMRSIELMGKEVIPALHEIKLEPYE
jgi:alkanesulfonate monooxygenase SsuD/methylene tetrahydromethanopterin reductase-like flavin-dependent oxidoreductase (luciferase family)